MRTLIEIGAAMAAAALASADYSEPHVGEGQKRARERQPAPPSPGEPTGETRQMRRARERREFKRLPNK